MNNTDKIMVAIKQNKLNKIKRLIKKNFDINTKDNFGETPLFNAARFNKIEIAEFLIKFGANVNEKNYEDQTPLHWATLFEQKDVAELLIKYGANIYAKDNKKQTPLDWAYKSNNMDMVELLKNATKNSYTNTENSPLPSTEEMSPTAKQNVKLNIFESVLLGKIDDVKKILNSRRKEVNSQDDKGWTPLMYAIMDNNLEMVKLLIENGADVNLCNNKGQSLLDICKKYKTCDEIMQYLKLNIESNVENE